VGKNHATPILAHDLTSETSMTDTTSSRIVLHSLHVTKNGDVLFRGSKGLRTCFLRELEGFASQAENSGCSTFEIMETSSGNFRAVPDERGPSIHSHMLASALLAAYTRSVCLELAFPTQEDYASWYGVARRVPTLKDLEMILARKGFQLAKPNVPYKGEELFHRVTVQKKKAEPQNKAPERRFVKDAHGRICAISLASFENLSKLQDRFRRGRA